MVNHKKFKKKKKKILWDQSFLTIKPYYFFDDILLGCILFLTLCTVDNAIKKPFVLYCISIASSHQWTLNINNNYACLHWFIITRFQLFFNTSSRKGYLCFSFFIHLLPLFPIQYTVYNCQLYIMTNFIKCLICHFYQSQLCSCCHVTLIFMSISSLNPWKTSFSVYIAISIIFFIFYIATFH